MALGLVVALPATGFAQAPPSTTSASTPATAGSAPSTPLCTPAVVTKVQQLVGAELAARVTQLDLLVARVNSATSLAASDKSGLLADLSQTEVPGIQALQTRVPATTTCLALRQDAHSMVYDYRVYLVMTPQTDLVMANDAAIHAEGVLSNLETVISGGIQYDAQHGTAVAGAEAAFADYQAKVTAAQGLTSGQSAIVLAQSPPGYPGTKVVFVEARTNLTNAVHDLHAARQDLAQIIHRLGPRRR